MVLYLPQMEISKYKDLDVVIESGFSSKSKIKCATLSDKKDNLKCSIKSQDILIENAFTESLSPKSLAFKIDGLKL